MKMKNSFTIKKIKHSNIHCLLHCLFGEKNAP